MELLGESRELMDILDGRMTRMWDIVGLFPQNMGLSTKVAISVRIHEEHGQFLNDGFRGAKLN